jgi:hypothetical protein
MGGDRDHARDIATRPGMVKERPKKAGGAMPPRRQFPYSAAGMVRTQATIASRS